MKALLVVGGVAFLLLGFILLVIAVVLFFVARGRKATAAPAAAPVRQPVAPPPPQPPPPPPPAPAPVAAAPVPTGDETVMVDPRRSEWGALEGTAGVLAGRVFPIDPAGFYIGRDRSLSQVIIDTPSVSKRHLWVGVRDGAVMAIDSSTNGTYLNTLGTRIGEVRLNPGDTLIISDDVARLVYRK